MPASVFRSKMFLNGWQPILEDASRERALDAVRAIVAALPDPKQHSELDDASLDSGAAGLSVLCAYLARAGFDDTENAVGFLARSMRAVASTAMPPALYGGFTGIAWAVAHLQDQLLDGEDDYTETIDDVLETYLSKSPWRGDYDLISGLVGIGVYALERLPRASAVRCLELIVARLYETAERNADGITWLTRPHLLPDWQRELCPNGYYNLGLAHGVPCVVALLGGVCAADVAVEKARPLLDGAVRWLLRQRLTGAARSSFPSWIGRDEGKRGDCRLAWCYGDAGIAAALLVAAHCVTESEWEREAVDIARRAAAREPESAGVRDACLCHGAAGLGHIFNRLFQITGEKDFREAARYWFERTLDLRLPVQGIAGYSVYRPGVNGGIPLWEDEAGILEGAAGIALTLLAAATDIEPEWDRMLLISMPNR